MNLPYLVTHGAWVWKALVVVGTVAAAVLFEVGWLLYGWWTTRSERMRRLAMVRAMKPLENPTTGHVQLRGVLRGGSLASIYYGSKSRGERSPRLWIECSGERVDLVGDITVVNGTRVVRTRQDAPHGLSPLARAELGIDPNPKVLLGVGDGDEVVVDGACALVAGTQDTMHRDSAGGWTMTSTADTPITLTATAPAWAPEPVSRAARIIPVLVAPAVIYGYLLHAGEEAVNGIGGFAGMSTTNTALAMPGSRAVALDQLERDSPANVRAAIAGARGHCQQAVTLLDDDEQFEAAVAMADDCGRRGLAVASLVHLARYQEARDALATSVDVSSTRRAEIHIATGDWAIAADDVRLVSDELEARCLVDYLHGLGGDAAAAARVDPVHHCDRAVRILAAMPSITPVSRWIALVDERMRVALVEQRPVDAARWQSIIDRYDAMATSSIERQRALYLWYFGPGGGTFIQRPSRRN